MEFIFKFSEELLQQVFYLYFSGLRVSEFLSVKYFTRNFEWNISESDLFSNLLVNVFVVRFQRFLQVIFSKSVENRRNSLFSTS